MSSAGQALNQSRDCIITTRDKNATLVIGDSGGYQIASGRLHINGDQDRHRILRWLEANADVAMTLDVPTGPVGKPGYRYSTPKECLTATLEHLEFFKAHRNTASDTVFLNVLQGNKTPDSDHWYEAVKHYPFEGWAFAGPLRHNFYNLCRRILIMADDNLIQNRAWIHILGTSEFATATCLTALQRSINRHLNPNLRISYDTSTPFRMISWRLVYALPKLDAKSMTMTSAPSPDDRAFLGSTLRWPWPSPLGDRMVLGDICVAKPDAYVSTWQDQQTQAYLTHHNLAALCSGVALANRIFDQESVLHDHTVARSVGAVVEAIERVIASGSLATLEGLRSTFSKLREETPTESDEAEHRVFEV